MAKQFLRFNDIYYLDENSINSIYSQLTENIESISIEKGKNANASLSASVTSFLLKLFGKDTNIDIGANVGFSKAETITRTKTLTDKFLDILKVIDEDEYKDIFYLIDKYMNNEKNIIAIGKGEFIALNLHDKKECAETRDVKFPIEINNMEFLLFSGEVEEESNYEELFNRLNPEFHSRTSISFSEIVFPSEEDITDTIYSQKVFVIIDPKKPQRMFEMHFTADRMFYFLGKIIEFEGNYFIFPYALWGRAVIL